MGGVAQAGAVYIYTMRTTGLAYLQTITANTGGFPLASSGWFPTEEGGWTNRPRRP